MSRKKIHSVGKGPVNLANEKSAIQFMITEGRLVDAYNRCAELCREIPSDAELWFLFGNVNNRLDRAADAEQCFQRVIALKPNIANAHFNLGCALVKQGNNIAAVEAFKSAIRLNQKFPEALNSLGVALIKLGAESEGIKYLREALELRPNYVEAHDNLSRALMQLVPRWHFPMLNDEARNNAYDKAIRAAVDKDSVVLDIGTGSGLLSMMAARAGARHVYTCEATSVIADKASEIIQRNGYQDKITVFPAMSTKLAVGAELPERANVLVSEIVDVGLLGEGVVASVQHARDNLLTPDAKIIPSAATVFAVLLESPELFGQNHVSTASGFDVSLFNEFSANHYQQFPLDNFPHKFLCEPFDVFGFDFTGEPICSESRKIPVNIVADGTCHAVAFWFRLFLDESIYIDTDPRGEGYCWMQAVQTIDSPQDVSAGSVLDVDFEHNCTIIRAVGMSRA